MIAALVISFSWSPARYAEQLIRVQAEQELAPIDKRILDEPLDVQATLLDYSRDRELVLKAWIALSKYKGVAREILLLYGSEAEFKEILGEYGESVIPVIQYFRDNDVWSVKAMDATGKAIDSISETVRRIWDRVRGNEPAKSDPATQPRPIDLGPTERGWYAVNFIKHEGYDFLGQFVVDKEKKAKWNQTARVLRGFTSFFTSGVRKLETKHDLGEDITTADVFWAGLDVALIAVPAKLLTAGKAVARSGEELSLTTRTRLFAPRLLSRGKMFQKLGAYGATAATIYIVATNPSLLNSAFAEIAKMIGVSPWVVQLAGWSIVIAVAIYLFSWLLMPMAKLILFCLGWLEKSRKKIGQKGAPSPNATYR